MSATPSRLEQEAARLAADLAELRRLTPDLLAAYEQFAASALQAAGLVSRILSEAGGPDEAVRRLQLMTDGSEEVARRQFLVLLGFVLVDEQPVGASNPSREEGNT